MAAPCHIPLIKLLGITPSGLNSSSDSEIRVFYDYVHAMQEALFTDPLEIILKVIQLDLFGEIDSNITFDYEPLYELDGEALARVRKSDADTAQVLIHGGVISAAEERMRLVGDPNSGYQGLDGALPVGQPQMGQDAEFVEEDHPRKSNGQFTLKGNGESAQSSNQSKGVPDTPAKAHSLARHLVDMLIDHEKERFWSNPYVDILKNTGEVLGGGAAALVSGQSDPEFFREHRDALIGDLAGLLVKRFVPGAPSATKVEMTAAKTAQTETKEAKKVAQSVESHAEPKPVYMSAQHAAPKPPQAGKSPQPFAEKGEPKSAKSQTAKKAPESESDTGGSGKHDKKYQPISGYKQPSEEKLREIDEDTHRRLRQRGTRWEEFKVSSHARVGNHVFVDTNPKARPLKYSRKDIPTLAAEKVAEKQEIQNRRILKGKKGSEIPNGTMWDAHAEVGAIQQAYKAGRTKNRDMVMFVKGENVCTHCKSAAPEAAKKAGLKSLTIHSQDEKGVLRTYRWDKKTEKLIQISGEEDKRN